MGWADVPMPPNVQALPRDKHGRPIPWFVATLEDGVRDPRIVSQEQLVEAHRLKLRWVCGQTRGAYLAFAIGPMCAVNRITSEPPAHRVCAEYSVQACPFLSRPTMVRRDLGEVLTDTTRLPAGHMIERNPGATAIWVTKSYKPFRAPGGVLFELGAPVEVTWWREGRSATRAEIEESIESGLPALMAADGDNPKAWAQLELARLELERWLPVAEGVAADAAG